MNAMTRPLGPADRVSAFHGERPHVLAAASGSALYGVATAQSDDDLRSVFLPAPREILLGRVNFGEDNNKTNARFGAGDIDIAGYSLMRYLGLLGRMDMITVETLFAARDSRFRIGPWTGVAEAIWQHRDRLIAGTASAAIGHARQRMGHLLPSSDRTLKIFDAVVALLEPHAEAPVLAEVPGLLDALHALDGVQVAARAHAKTSQCVLWDDLPEDDRTAGRSAGMSLYVEVPAKKITAAGPVRDAIAVARKPLDRLEARRRAEKRGPQVEWKDAYHGVRLIRQARDYLATRELTFPRPDAPELLAIRNGEKSTEWIGETCLVLLEEVHALEERSPLDPEPDHDLIEDISVWAHSGALSAR